MAVELRAKSFKSGNSVAVRLPAALGVTPGSEWTVIRADNGDLVLRPKEAAKRKFDVEAIWGIGADLGLRPFTPEERVFAPSAPRVWDDDFAGHGTEQAPERPEDRAA